MGGIFIPLILSVILSSMHCSGRKETFVFPEDHRFHHNAGTEWLYFNFIDTTDSVNGSVIYGRDERLVILKDSKRNKSFILNEKGILTFTDNYMIFTADSTVDSVHFSAGKIYVTISGNINCRINLLYDDIISVADTGIIELLNSYSYYYSIPRIELFGVFELQEDTYQLAATGWLDHQWGPFLPGDDPYTWFDIMLESGENILVWKFESRKNGEINIFRKGYFDDVFRSSANAEIIPVVYYESRYTGRIYPFGWRIIDKTLTMDIIAEPLYMDFEIPTIDMPLFQGPCKITGILGKRRVSGIAFMEFTGFYNRDDRLGQYYSYEMIYRKSLNSILKYYKNKVKDR